MSEQKAEELLKLGKKKEFGTNSFMSSFLGNGANPEEAVELYVQAANQFKLLKKWEKVVECLDMCTRVSKNLNQMNDAATYLQEAANICKKFSTKDALKKYKEASAIYAEGGKFSQGGKLLKTCAEVIETEEGGDLDVAIELYRGAVDLFEMDEFSKQMTSQCNLKIADLLALKGVFHEAANLYEKEGEKCLAIPALQYSAKDHFFKCLCMFLAMNDTVTCKIKFDRITSLDSRFYTSREGELIDEVLTSMKSQDLENFEKSLKNYTKISNLNKICKMAFDKVRESLGNETEEGVDLT